MLLTEFFFSSFFVDITIPFASLDPRTWRGIGQSTRTATSFHAVEPHRFLFSDTDSELDLCDLSVLLAWFSVAAGHSGTMLGRTGWT